MTYGLVKRMQQNEESDKIAFIKEPGVSRASGTRTGQCTDCHNITGRRKALHSESETPSVSKGQHDPHDASVVSVDDRSVALRQTVQEKGSERQQSPITLISEQDWLDFWAALRPVDEPYRTLVYWAEVRAQRKREIPSGLLSGPSAFARDTRAIQIKGSDYKSRDSHANYNLDSMEKLLLARGISTFGYPLSIDRQLFVSIQYNTFRGALSNLMLLLELQGRPIRGFEDFDLEDLPAPPNTAPPALQATELQKAIPHDFWIDTIPYPVLRDNIIRNQNKVDMDSLCEDFVGGLYHGESEIGSRGLILWGEPWSDDGWEVGEGFARKWSFLLEGCADLINSTNRWRKDRTEERLIVEI